MLRRFIVIALASSLCVACATTGGKERLRPQRIGAQPAPAWSTAEGRLDARLDMAESMLEAGHPERAAQVLATAREEQPSGWEIDLLQARTFQALGMTTEALGLLEPYRDKRRRDAELFHLMGLLEFDLDMLDRAAKDLERAAELAPESAEIANNLGFLMLVSGEPGEAVSWLRQAVGIDPSQQRYRNNLGFALAADGQSEQALQVFRAAGTESLALARLGVAHERAEQRQLALARYHQALQIDPNQPVARAGLERIAPSSDTE